MSQKGLFSQVLRTGLRRYSVSHTFDSASSQSNLVIAGEISKSVQKRPKVPRSDQKLAHCMALTRFWEFPKLNMQFPGNFQKCPKAPKSCQKCPNIAKVTRLVQFSKATKYGMNRRNSAITPRCTSEPSERRQAHS